MATTPESISGSPRGITNTLDGFVVESEALSGAPVQEDFDDQTGARADEKVYDQRENLRLTVYGATASADIDDVLSDIVNSGGKKIDYAGKKWKIDDVEEAGVYNGKRRWNITAHKFNNFPPQT